MLVGDLNTPKQRDWLRFIVESARNPVPQLGCDLAIDIGSTFDVIYTRQYNPMLVRGVAALVQALLLGLEVEPGTWWISDWGSWFGRSLGVPFPDPEMQSTVLDLLKAEPRIVRGTESVRVIDLKNNRQAVEAEFVPIGLKSPFILYSPVRGV